MKSYHVAWLSVHPERTEEWLSARLKDGFDVHHLDGNHDNDDPGNLVLIECGDHLMLHGTHRRITRLDNFKNRNEKAKTEAIRKGRAAYHGYLSSFAWGAVAEGMGLDWTNGDKARSLAGKYAAANGLKWPLRIPRKGMKCKPKVFARAA